MRHSTLSAKLPYLILASILFIRAVIAADEARTPPLSSEFIFTVLDGAGRPMAGVHIGSILYNTDPENQTGESVLTLMGEQRGPAAATDASGQVRVSREFLFWEGDDRPRPVIALTDRRELMGLALLRPDQTENEIAITLKGTCQLTVRPTCPFFKERGREMSASITGVNWNGFPLYEHRSKSGEHRLPLPPGDYKLHVHGTDTYTVRPNVTIEPGEQTRELNLDLPPTRIAELTGQRAPELQQIKAWRGGDPVTLEELHGRVVLLEFWGYWCGPCVARMPELFELHDRYHDSGLDIIAVHDDSVADVAELDEKLVDIREQLWDGRDLPFRVAIDGGGEQAVPGRHATVQGATTAAYGVPGWPTCVLIDREGVVRGRVFPSVAKDQELIEELVRGGAPSADD